MWAVINRRQARLGRRIEEVPESTMEALVRYAWPANVRELQNALT